MSLLYHGRLTFTSFERLYSDNRTLLGVMCVTIVIHRLSTGGAQKVTPEGVTR
jgi:hypothetical protein